jgi:hypothetical protein
LNFQSFAEITGVVRCHLKPLLFGL